MSIASRCMKTAAVLLISSLHGFALAAPVEFFSPQGEVKKVRQVAARFPEQMVAFGDPREVDPFDVDCPAKGKGRWADQRNWVYDFEHDLPAGVACRFTVKKGLATLGGKPVESGTYRFNTGGPGILQSEPYQGNYGIDENQIFILGLDAPATTESVQKHAWCTADGIPERIPVRVIAGKFRASVLGWRDAFLSRYYRAIFGEGNEGRSFIFSIDERGTDREKFMKLRDGKDSPIVVLQCMRTLPNNTPVKLVWGKGIESVSGALSSQVQTLSFRTRPVFEAKFSCSRTNEKAGCIPVIPMELNLSAPVSLEVAQRVKLVAANGKSYAPVISDNEKKVGSVQWLHFPAPLPERTTFRIVLPQGFVDDAGRPPANAANFPLEVRTDEHPPLAKFAARFGILELNATNPPLLPITLRNIEPSLAGNLTDPPVPGKALRADFEARVIDWLRRLEDIDSIYAPGTYNEDANRGPGKNSIFGKEDGVKPFALPKPLGDKAFEVVGIPLPEPGFYVVEVASPRLGKALHAADRPYYAHAAALVTNLAVHFKQGRESSLAWVTSLDKGKPVPNAEIAVRDCGGKRYFEGRSDASGLLKINKELPPLHTLPGCLNGYDRQYFVTARLGKDFSFVLSGWNEGIALWRFNAFEGGWQKHDILHAILDRTLLRAGETVHMKLVARRKTAAGFNRPEGKLPEAVVVQLQGGEDKFTLPVGWDGNGIAVADWAIPRDTKQGTWVILVNDEEIGRFRVAEFRVPTMKAILLPPTMPLVNSEEALLNIQVNYLSGGGASRLPVRLRGRLAPKIISFADYEDFTFANGGVIPGIQKRSREPWNLGEYMLDEPDEDTSPAKSDAGAMLATQELRLDDAGSARAAFAKLPPSEISRNIEAELEYQDPNGETLTAATRISLWSSRTIVGLKPDGWMATADHLKFHALVLGLDGKPRAGEKVVVKALKREYFSHRRRLIGGFYAFDNHSEIKEAGELCAGTTDDKGLLICDVKAPASGNIILQAETRDADGNASIANREIWVAGDDDWWFDASDNDRIDLLPEKKRYEPGEKARFQLRMPFREADVLVTVEREGVLDSFVTHLTRDNPTIEVPLKGHYAPNVFVSVLAVRGRINDAQPTALIDLGKPAFKMGLAEIRVGWAAHELKVRVATDKPTYRIREKAKVSVDVRSPDGSIPPRGTEIALAAVDEGLLELKPNESWKLLEAMMQRRGIEVETSTAQMQVIGKRHFGRKALPAGGGGGASPSRELFDTLLFWQARVRLDANGHAEVEVPLNDSLTSFRIVAVANGMDQFGTGAASINSTQDLMLFSGLPPVVREQDRFHAGFTVRNGGDHAVEAVVTAKASTLGKAVGDLAPITLKLPPGESRNVGWDVNVPLDVEALKWEVSVREQGKGEDGDRLKVSQKVIAAVPVRTLQATVMQLESPQAIAVRLPDGAILGRGGVRVTFRKRLGDGLEGVAEFMARYPYTCMEQLASQAIALQDEARWNALMKKLPAYLDRDGLVKFFPMMENGDDTLTAYLISIAGEAGYAIPAEARDRMHMGLRGFIEGRVIRYSALPTSDLTVRKLAAIEALSRGGDIDRRWLDSIEIAPNLWPTSAVLDWLAILQRTPGISGQSARQADEARQIVRSRLNFQGTTMGFSTERNDALWWLMTNGDVNANRVLLTLLDRPDWKPDMPRLVRGALGRQQRGHWSTTVANAWGVLAMKKFSALFEGVPVEGATTAELGKSRLRAEWRDDTKEAQQLLDWPAATTPVKLAHEGHGKPWATLQSLAALPLKEPLSTGYRITRKVVPVSQKAKGEWHKGDVARVSIEVDAQSDMAWVVVNDPIPSGASILGTGLGGDSKLMTSGEKKQGWVWPAFEERTFDSFRAYYRFVPKGKFSVEYTVRLNNDGEFKLPVTRVEAMYAPEMFGERPNGSVTVKP